MKPGEVICETCADTGWQYFTCPGDQSCGRWRQHLPHDYVKPCFCRETNTAWQDKQRRQRRPAA